MKALFRKVLRTFGLELRRYVPARSDLARLARILSSNGIDLVLDVGANTGQYAQQLREIGYTGRIVSFEPLAAAHAQLLAASSRDPLWDVAPRGAIGGTDGEIDINVSRNSYSSSALPIGETHLRIAPDSAYIGTERVRLSRLDTVAPRYLDAPFRSVLLKADVQGFEAQVLAGASGILPAIKVIQLELSLVRQYEGGPLFREMLDRMTPLGYDLHAVMPGFTDARSGRLLQMDGIFVRI